jgi:hypothetical protein
MQQMEGRRRRLTLAPLRPPDSPQSASASSPGGSRFSCLRSEDGGSDEEANIPFQVAAQALEGEFEEGWTPVCRRRKSKEETMADFWRENGYPTPVARVWEASRRSSSGELLSGCRSAAGSSAADCPGTSANAPPMVSPRSGSCSSPTGVRLARGPRMGPWRGPLPRRRVSPPLVLGTFIDRAFAGSTDFASSSLAAAAGMGSSSSAGFQELEVQTRAIIAVQTADDSADRVGDVIAVDHVNRDTACPLVHRYGLGHLVHRFRSLWVPF